MKKIESTFVACLGFVFLFAGSGTCQEVSATGLWTGDMGEYSVKAVVSPDNELCVFSDIPHSIQYFGDISITGDEAGGSITGYWLESLVFSAEESLGNGTVDLDITEGFSIAGSYSTTDDIGFIDFQYLSDLEIDTDLSDAAGDWHYHGNSNPDDGVEWGDFSIKRNGSVNGYIAREKDATYEECSIDGQLSLIDSSWRIFSATALVSDYSPYNGSYSGLAMIDGDGYLWVMISNSTFSSVIRLDGIQNYPPSSDPGIDQEVPVGSLVTLDGSSSYDEDGDLLTYHWRFVFVPTDSTATLYQPDTVNPTFVPDLPGSYYIELVVDDGEFESDPATVLIAATGSDSGDDTPDDTGDDTPDNTGGNTPDNTADDTSSDTGDGSVDDTADDTDDYVNGAGECFIGNLF